MSYKDLKSFQQATIAFDFTVEFCKRYIDKRSRTHDQMTQAGRSGKQNIAEGSANKTSEKSELKLLGVARASFQELLEDYEDFLRQRNLRQWGSGEPTAQEVRQLAYKTNKSYGTYMSYMEDPEKAANTAICLISQTNYLLDKQISVAEAQFVKTGGYTENLFRKRNQERKRILGRWPGD